MCLRYTGIMPGARALTQSITPLAVRVRMLAMAYAPAFGSTPMTIVRVVFVVVRRHDAG